MEAIKTSPVIRQPQAHNALVRLLIAAGIEQPSRSILDYERAKRIIVDHCLDAESHEDCLSIAIDYIGV